MAETTETKRMISRRSTIVAAQGQVSCDLADEVVILTLKTGMYYGLDAVGAKIWHFIQEPRTAPELRDALVQEYEVEPGRCERDLLRLLQTLAANGLIEVTDDAGGQIPAPPIP
jgi:Coenzyme PQQ synthesis protein D (PqqD)